MTAAHLELVDREPDQKAAPARARNRLALLGFARTYTDAPFADSSVRIVGMNELYKLIPRWDVWFELHDIAYLGKTARVETPDEPTRHLAWLKAQPPDKPIYMLRRFPEIPASVPYPLEAMVARFGRYFTSSVGYMIAWAIEEILTARHDPYVPEPGEWIGLYGIDLASDTEYRYQRPNAEYLVGFAKGLGIQVDVPETAAILHGDSLYGYEPPPMESGYITEWYLRNELKQQNEKIGHVQARLNTLDGVIEAWGFLIEQRGRPELQLTDAQVAQLHVLIGQKRAQHGQTLADWNAHGGVIQAYTKLLQVMEFKRRGVYVPETDRFATPSTSGIEG